MRNELALIRWRSADAWKCPLVIRVTYGGYLQGGAIYHSQCGEVLFTHLPGLRVVIPSTAQDANGLLRTAIRCDDPVLFLEHKRLYSIKEDERAADGTIGSAAIVRPGSDITLVSVMKGVHDCLAAAEELSTDGIDAEVLDLRTLRPLDRGAILTSLSRTNRLVAVEEGPLTGGWAGEVLAVAAEAGLGDIDDVWRITTPDTPIPYSPALEDAFFANGASIASEVRQRLGESSPMPAGPVKAGLPT
jgi:acetoin:2,6-dichlorophenolindophenol oxidoreductase subunit beta